MSFSVRLIDGAWCLCVTKNCLFDVELEEFEKSLGDGEELD